MVGSFYRPPDKGVIPILELENQLSEIMDTLKNNPKTLFLVVILTQGVLTGESGLVPDDSPNRLLNGKLIEVIPKQDFSR